jgi:hypothetical protein
MFGIHYQKVVCADGFEMSVQASSGHYCSPRDDVGPYGTVEVGFPTAKDPQLEKFAEDPDAEICKDSGTVQTVYGWVPAETIRQIIESHGGISDGELPELAETITD